MTTGIAAVFGGGSGRPSCGPPATPCGCGPPTSHPTGGPQTRRGRRRGRRVGAHRDALPARVRGGRRAAARDRLRGVRNLWRVTLPRLLFFLAEPGPRATAGPGPFGLRRVERAGPRARPGHRAGDVPGRAGVLESRTGAVTCADHAAEHSPAVPRSNVIVEVWAGLRPRRVGPGRGGGARRPPTASPGSTPCWGAPPSTTSTSTRPELAECLVLVGRPGEAAVVVDDMPAGPGQGSALGVARAARARPCSSSLRPHRRGVRRGRHVKHRLTADLFETASNASPQRLAGVGPAPRPTLSRCATRSRPSSGSAPVPWADRAADGAGRHRGDGACGAGPSTLDALTPQRAADRPICSPTDRTTTRRRPLRSSSARRPSSTTCATSPRSTPSTHVPGSSPWSTGSGECGGGWCSATAYARPR